MRRRYEHSRPARTGFTLIELLVVIAIIAILVSLTAAAVMRVRHQAEIVQNRHNISQLSTTIQSFCSKNSIDYIPSRIVLRNDGNYDPTVPLERASLSYLRQLWPQLQFPVFTANVYPATDQRYSAGWCPDDPAAALTSRYELEGDQCLVFFLGGIQRGKACQGFSVNKRNPTLISNGVKTEPPSMEFPMPDLDYQGTASATRAGTFLSYLDPYGTPYAYFSSRSFGRRWGPSDPQYVAALDQPYLSAPGYARLDCAGLSATLGSYYDPSGKFYSRDGFQIISAGPDKLFGQGGLWDARTGQPHDSPTSQGHDDQASFHPAMLGAGS